MKSAWIPGRAVGFSLLELMIVVGISLVVAAVAIPNVLSAIYTAPVAKAILDSTVAGRF